jgi:hypothetical protein
MCTLQVCYAYLSAAERWVWRSARQVEVKTAVKLPARLIVAPACRDGHRSSAAPWRIECGFPVGLLPSTFSSIGTSKGSMQEADAEGGHERRIPRMAAPWSSLKDLVELDKPHFLFCLGREQSILKSIIRKIACVLLVQNRRWSGRRIDPGNIFGWKNYLRAYKIEHHKWGVKLRLQRVWFCRIMQRYY